MDKPNAVSVVRAFNANQAALMDIARLLGRGTDQSIDEAEKRMETMLEIANGIQRTVLGLKKQLKVDLEDKKAFISSVMTDLESMETLDNEEEF